MSTLQLLSIVMPTVGTVAPQAGADGWIDPPVKGAPRRMLVKVLTDTNRRFEYEALFRSSFDAYDDAMDRYPHASRIEVQPAQPKGGRHGA